MSTDLRKPSICIVSHNAYGAISGGRSGFIGGVEWQTALTARWFAAHGYPVTLVTWNEGGPPEETIDDVRVLKVCAQDAGWPGLRFFHPKWTSLVRALRTADAAVYYHNCGECVTGQMALWCRQNRRPFVFSLASNADCDPRLPELKSGRERLLYRIGLRRADKVIAQTFTQQAQLRKHFGVEAEVIPMPCPGPANGEFQPPDVASRRVLWVGRISAVKRPDRFLDLAEQCPEMAFDLVGPFFEDSFSQAVRRRADRIPNVVVHGQIAKSGLGDFYRRAAVLCCTSDYEGFPNTFLEAWSYGLPVVSTFDPDDVIVKHRLGLVGRELSELRQALLALVTQQNLHAECSRRVRAYYEANHTMTAVMPRMERAMMAAISSCPAPGCEAASRKVSAV